jgi:hypothetical protein
MWATRGFEWCGGKFFEITRTIVVPYSVSYILPAADYRDVALDNKATNAINLYPAAEGRVYEILVGLKPGAYHIIPYIPAGKYLLALGDSSMFPDVADANRRYLGAITPEDSPAEDPVLKLWAIKDYDAWTLRTFVLDGVGFEKCGLEFKVAKHELTKLKEAPPTFSLIKHHSEIEGIW